MTDFEKEKNMTALELMLYVDNRSAQLFYHKDTETFDWMRFSSIEMQHIDMNALLPMVDENNIRFLTYEEIDHKGMMSFFVHECIDDKEMRKKLFGILRRDSYVEPYIEALKELELYDDFVLFSENVYNQMFREWAEKNGLEF